MQMPAVDDTIIAVSSGWEAAAIGIVRLSGPDSFELARALGPAPPGDWTSARPVWSEARVRLGRDHILPATVLWFRRSASYTGQDLLELHTVGCLPVLRALSARLIELGARRALPGEFTARAYLNSKLDAWQVAGVLSLIGAENEASARQAARLSRGRGRQLLNELTDRLTELLARIEAGIDFVEQEDIRFITPGEVCRSIDAMREMVSGLTAADRGESWGGKPHVALVGLPNAGKSTLFNALLGYERAIVSPILGTTRDVLSAEIELNGLSAVLQDCAGLGQAADELELATHLAAERTADQADLVLWVHDVTMAWDARETAACGRVPAGRRVLVRSKCDLEPVIQLAGTPVDFDATVDVSAATRAGLAGLKRVLADRLEVVAGRQGGHVPLEELGPVRAGLERAREIASAGGSDLANPEIVALELRSAWAQLGSAVRGPVSEEVLDRIFAQFCIGK